MPEHERAPRSAFAREGEGGRERERAREGERERESEKKEREREREFFPPPPRFDRAWTHLASGVWNRDKGRAGSKPNAMAPSPMQICLTKNEQVRGRSSPVAPKVAVDSKVTFAWRKHGLHSVVFE